MPLDGGTPSDSLIAAVGRVYSVNRSPEEWACVYERDPEKALGRAIVAGRNEGFFAEVLAAMLQSAEFGETERRRILLHLVRILGSGMEAPAAGRMQALLTVEARLSNAAVMLPALIRTGRACAEVRVRRGDQVVAGSGFLVADDLLLTAAHVVGGLVGATPEDDAPGGNITVEFRNRLEAPEARWPAQPLHAAERNWRVFWSRPSGEWPALGDAADDCLDCTLIRLAAPVPDGVPRLDVLDPPPPDEGAPLHVMGHLLGVGRLSFDRGTLRKGGCGDTRVRHMAATVEGMSGGPCLNSDGRVLALHEGTANRPDPEHNRGVVLRSIRRAMRDAGEADPLDTVGRAATIVSEAAVREMAERLEDPVVANDRRHPVMGRQLLRDWLNPATAAGAKPILLVSGEPGCGKSFTGHLLQAWLRNVTTALAAIPPEAVRRGNDHSMVARVHTALGLPPPPLPSQPSRRAVAGERLRDLLDPALREWESRIAGGSVRRLVIFVDAGVPATWALPMVNEFWSDLLRLVLPRRDWLHVAIAGLARDNAFALRSNIGARHNDVLAEHLDEPDWYADIWPAAVVRLAAERRPADDAAEAALHARWEAGLPKGRPENHAAWAAYCLRSL